MLERNFGLVSSLSIAVVLSIISVHNIVIGMYHQNQNNIDPQGVTLNTIAAMTSIPNSGQCPALPPSPGNLCVPPAGNQVCLYDGGQGGTSEDSPLIVNCCCGRCPDDVTCAPDSITGSGLWQSIAYSPLCPTEGCGTDGK